MSACTSSSGSHHNIDIGVYHFDFDLFNIWSVLKFIEALFDKDVNQSEQQERDHKATRGPTKPSSEKETVTEGLVPAVERSSEEETATEGLVPAVERS